MTIQILPLGDSITQGERGRASYRRPLYFLLEEAGYDFDFVGSLTGNHDDENPYSDFDLDHEGHWGWTADEILSGDPTPESGSGSGTLAEWLTGYTPDVVLMHLGTNDMFRNDTVETALADLQNVIEQLRLDNPNVTVLLAQVIPTTGNRDDRLVSLNEAIPQFAADNSTVDSQIVVVDQYAGFDAATDTYDGVHPNESGEAKIAQNWFNALEPFIAVAEPPTADSDLGDRTTEMWEFTEWDLLNPTFSGNPFDLMGSVTFTHTASGETRTTGIYYDGGEEWSFRFTGDLSGEWTFQTQSTDSDLNGFTGSVDVSTNDDPNIQGFLTHVGNKFAIQTADANTLEGYLPNVYMNQNEHFKQGALGQGWSSADTTAYLNDARNSGFETLYFQVNNNWFSLGAEARTEHDSRNPDLDTFQILEQIIVDVHQQGGRVHFWAWGDEDRQWTPIDGINSAADQRLQRYLAARLGPLPGWSMGYAFDTQEFTNDNQMDFWANNLLSLMGWDHLLFARGYAAAPGLDIVDPTNNNDWVATALSGHSYSSKGNNQPGLQTSPVGPLNIEEVIADINSDSTKPHFYEERFTHNRSFVGSTTGVTYDVDQTRRTLWWQAMAGGVAGWYGFFDRSGNEGPPYPNLEQLRTHQTFWTGNGRFTLDLEQANDLADSPNTYLLKRSDDSRYIIYGEDVDAIQVDLPNLVGATNVIAVDTKAEYQEINFGVIEPGNDRQLLLPYLSDWALVVEGLATPDTTAPTAILDAADLEIEGGSIYRFNVAYSDDRAVNISSLDDQDVEVIDENGQSIPVTFISADTPSNGSPLVATYAIQAPGGAWDESDNGTYSVRQIADQVTDTAENAVAAGFLGSFVVNITADTTSPSVVDVSALTLSTFGSDVYTFTVTYGDDQAIALASLDSNDITVTGPNGFSQTAVLVEVNASDDGTPITGTYQITATSGNWNTSDNGTYQILLNGDEVSDLSGNSVPAITLSNFTIAIPDLPNYSEAVRGLNPLAYWTGDEITGTTAVDSIGTNDGIYQNDLTLGAPGAIATASTTAISFDGIDDYLEIPHSVDFDLAEGTLLFWINPNVTSQLQTLVSKDSSGFDNGGHFTLSINENQALELRTQSTGSSRFLTSTGRPVVANTWQLLAVTWGANGIRVYLDGEQVAIDERSAFGWVGNEEPLVLGASQSRSGDLVANQLQDFFSGSLDEIALFADVLSGSSIEQLYAAGIALTSQNTIPVAVSDRYATDEDTPLSVTAAQGLLSNDSDGDNDVLQVTSSDIVSTNGGTVSINSDGSFSYTPADNFNGTDTFDYTISDGNGGTDTATVTLTVTAVNDAPIATSDAQITTKNQPLVIAPNDLIANDRDDDNDALTVTSVGAASNGSVTQDPNSGEITFTADVDFTGEATFEYTVSDGNDGTDTATVTVTVVDVNDFSPVAQPDEYTLDEDIPLSVAAAQGLLSNDSDGDNDALQVTSSDIVSTNGGNVSINSDGSFSYTPADNFNGTDTFDYTLSDGNGGTDTATVTLTVNAVNDLPIANSDTVATAANTPLTIPVSTLLNNDSDVETASLTVVEVTNPSNGTVRFDAIAQTITFTPETDFAGIAQFQYTLQDEQGAQATTDVAVAVAVAATPDDSLLVWWQLDEG
ncbi:cadherin-like domain-containing protein, partial [Oscillatoria sp. CS-180]|uniref:cadherin-like domain-containing protein n=1 Tax=Oscillatoria sp. CS-180 TaxID=3021720 RepID=UPI00232FFC76